VPKVLIVDDSEICRDTVRFLLEQRGIAVVALDSPFELSAALNRERPDLVLCDVSMPALGGDKLVEITTRHRLHRCPIVLFSDRPEAELSRLVTSSGASGFLQKTFDADELERAIRGFLADPTRT